jgi:hypothetical protein
MLAAEYGSWSNGEEVPPFGPEEIRSSPLGAEITRYGIGISAQSTLGGGGWSIGGGLVGRAALGSTDVELFGKAVARVHGVKRTSDDQDESYEFFLVLRPSAPGAARALRQWRFSWEELAPTVAPQVAESLRRRYTGAELEKELERAKAIYVHGYLKVDQESKVATIAITGLKKPFQERVDLSGELP